MWLGQGTRLGGDGVVTAEMTVEHGLHLSKDSGLLSGAMRGAPRCSHQKEEKVS